MTRLLYSFLGLLPASESLAVRGRRLHDTAYQRQNKIYAPDVLPKVEIEGREQRLTASLTDAQPDVLARGEIVRISLRLENTGTRNIGEVWLVHSPSDEILVEESRINAGPQNDLFLLDLILIPYLIVDPSDTFVSTNSVQSPEPIRLPLQPVLDKSVLEPDSAVEIPFELHASEAGRLDLHFMLVFREVSAAWRGITS